MTMRIFSALAVVAIMVAANGCVCPPCGSGVMGVPGGPTAPCGQPLVMTGQIPTAGPAGCTSCTKSMPCKTCIPRNPCGMCGTVGCTTCYKPLIPKTPSYRCGKVYLGEWIADPPGNCDPCDRGGNWIGPQCCPPRLHRFFAALFGHQGCCPDRPQGGVIYGHGAVAPASASCGCSRTAQPYVNSVPYMNSIPGTPIPTVPQTPVPQTAPTLDPAPAVPAMPPGPPMGEPTAWRIKRSHYATGVR